MEQISPCDPSARTDSYRALCWPTCGHLWGPGDLTEGRPRISNCLTWAKCDVAEFCLLLRALAGVPTKLWGLARAGPVPVPSPTSGRAQAPRRPLVPGAMHCNQSRRSKFPFQRKSLLEKWLSPLNTASYPLPHPPELAAWEKLLWEGQEQTSLKSARGTWCNFFVILYWQQVSFTFHPTWNKLKCTFNSTRFSACWAKGKCIFLEEKMQLAREEQQQQTEKSPFGKQHRHHFLTCHHFFPRSTFFLIESSKATAFSSSQKSCSLFHNCYHMQWYCRDKAQEAWRSRIEMGCAAMLQHCSGHHRQLQELDF